MGAIEGNELVARALKGQGVDHIFTVVGGPVIETIGACGDLGVRPIGCRHEQAAVMMAQAYAYVSGKPGVAALASGPAVTNGVTGVHVAWDNCWPVVVLGGSSSSRFRGLMPFQEADSVALMKPITKWATQVESAENIPQVIAMALEKAISGRPGPVYVDLPGNVLNEQSVEEERIRGLRRGLPTPARPLGDLAAVARAAELLASAERPLLLVGKGVRWSEATAELADLVDRVGLPFLPSPMGRGFIPDDHPLCVSAARSFAMRNADVVLLLGARMNWMFGMGSHFAPDARIIQVDIEPEEIGLQRPVEVGIVGDAGQVVRQLVEAVAPLADGLAARRRESAWQHDLREQVRTNEERLAPLLNADDVPMGHHRLFKEIRDFLPRDAIISVDGQMTLATGRQVLPSYLPASRLNSGSNGCMGVGVPFAIGAKLARPDRPVISINGDCAFGFNCMEMETALRHNANVVFVVDNNDGIVGNSVEKAMFKSPYPERVAMYLPGIRYDKIMEAFGGYGEHVERPEEVRPALERAFASGKAACINVQVNPDFTGPLPRRASQLMAY